MPIVTRLLLSSSPAMNALSPTLTLSGKPLSFGALARIGAHLVTLTPDAAAMRRVERSHEVVAARIAQGLPVYGSNTGVGAMKDVAWTDDELETFNLGLVRAHHFGTGVPFPNSVVRTAMAIRVNTALTGRVGCTPDLVNAYLALLAADVVPVVRRTGSIGCADIGLMGQIGAVLTGVGEAVYQNRRLPADRALADAGLKPAKMPPRDSLASISVNAVGFAAAAEAVRSAAGAVRMLLATSLTTAGARSARRAIRGERLPTSAPSARRKSAAGFTVTPWAGTGPTPPTCRTHSACA